MARHTGYDIYYTMRIAAVQFHVDHDDKQSNWGRVEYFLAEAQKQKVDLIVFPE